MRPSPQIYLYAEFTSPEIARLVRDDLVWPPPNDIIAGCGDDPNPCVVKILVYGETISPKAVRGLAERIGALRITTNHQQLYPERRE